jgi:hypothetical protein
MALSRRAFAAGLCVLARTPAIAQPAVLRRPFVMLEQFGGGTSAEIDNVQPWSRMLQECVKNNLRKLILDFGDYSFKSMPSTLPFALDIEGVGGPDSKLIRDYQPKSEDEPFLHWSGETGERGGGSRDMMVVIGNGTTDGRMIYITGSDELHRPQWMRFEHVEVNGYPPSGDGRCWRTFEINGVNIATQGTQGVRDITLTDCWLYRASDAIVMVRNGTQFSMHGGGCGSRGAGRARIVIDGGGSPLSNTTNFELDTYIAGDVVVRNCDNGHVSGIIGGDLVIEATAGRGKSVALVGAKITNASSAWIVE